MRKILEEKAKALVNHQKEIDVRLSIINHILEKDGMKYQVTIKEIPEMTVYYSEKRLAKYSDMMQVIPKIGRASTSCMNEHVSRYRKGGYRVTDSYGNLFEPILMN